MTPKPKPQPTPTTNPSASAPSAPAALDAATREKVLALLTSGLGEASVLAACTAPPPAPGKSGGLGLSAADAESAVEAARAKLLLIARANWTEERGRAIARCHDIYKRSLTVQDGKTALAAQRELGKIMALYAAPLAAEPVDEPAAGEASDGSDADAGPGGAGGPRRPGDQAAAEIVAAVDLHLEPLALVDDAAEGDAPATYADLIAAAAAEILFARSARARAARSAKKKPTTKPAAPRAAKALKTAKQAKKPAKRRRE
ncbi:MAG TPA: hypothetical protein VMW52_12490 [Phycisphaerae bacterium]|nr:hypothetical protein [Phycisphaerae bacterium]